MPYSSGKYSPVLPGNASPNTRRLIGIYVDHKSEGHRRRAIAIAKHAPDYFTLLGTGLKGKSDALPIVELPEDSCFDLSQKHASPSQQKKAKNPNSWVCNRRLQRISDWLDTAKPALLLVDSCVEVAALAQEKDIPTVYMRLSGRRNDSAHLQAFARAKAVLCPFHPLLESKETPLWLSKHSHYFPGLTAKRQALRPDRNSNEMPVMLIVAGHNCSRKKHISASEQQLAAAAAALPEWQIQVIGRFCPPELEKNCPQNLQFYGWVENEADFMREADIIVGAASDCLITAVAAAGKPFICLPQKRPFDEQFEKAERLEKLQAATICRKWPRNWAKTVKKTLKQGAVLSALHEENAAAHAADFLLNLAWNTKHHTLLAAEKPVSSFNKYITAALSHFKHDLNINCQSHARLKNDNRIGRSRRIA